MSYKSIPLDNFSDVFSATTELSSVALGGRIVSVSDEFFAEAFHLLLVEPAPSMKGQFGPNGALYSGWESRRHNPAHDWCIIQLGTAGSIIGFDVDTSNFNGNEAPECSIEALLAPTGEDVKETDSRWREIQSRTPLGPSSRHLFTIPKTESVNYVKLNMYPDGGIARFRVYGHVTPIHPADSRPFDLAHVFSGGIVDFVSDQHFGVGANLILPGRGKDMGDGWETKRSRVKGHKDWVVIKLGAPGILEQTEIDTAHFKGNFPESCELHALFSEQDIDWKTKKDEDLDWTLILPRTKLGPHRQHYFQLENVEKAYTHVKVTIHPDGGLKRVRLIGRKAGVAESKTNSAAAVVEAATTVAQPNSTSTAQHIVPELRTIPTLPLTPEAFAQFGQVIQAYGDHTAAPKGTKITPANAGSASKFHKLSLLESSYPADRGETTGISVYRCSPLTGLAEDGSFELTTLERHAYTNQAFIPMGPGPNEGLKETAERYLVIVAKNGEDDRPDLKTTRAFVASTGQGIVYNTGVWHQPMTVLGKALDMACVETQVGDGSSADCEIVDVGGVLRVHVV